MSEPHQQVPAPNPSGGDTVMPAIPQQPRPEERAWPPAGPLPPRINPPPAPQPSPYPRQQPLHYPQQPVPGQPGPPSTAQPPLPQPGGMPPGFTVPPGMGLPPGHTGPMIGYPAARPARPSRVISVLLAVVVVILVGMVSWQTFKLSELSADLGKAQRQTEQERAKANEAAEAVASRVSALEKASFHPDQIAAAALPSVFRVKAGPYSGTAWAVGKPAPSGGAFLFTNFHVVESVWDSGLRSVSIEHKDLRFDAKIVKVDKGKDVAQLETSAKFPGLSVSKLAVRPGEPVVVVGAPLGLESSVTTGVVSAFRKLEGTNDTYVQFDAAINPGNSGGPVINARGEVVGIASAKIRNAEGIGLAIPIGIACDLFPICG